MPRGRRHTSSKAAARPPCAEPRPPIYRPLLPVGRRRAAALRRRLPPACLPIARPAGVQRLAPHRFRCSACADVRATWTFLEQAAERASAIPTPRQALALA